MTDILDEVSHRSDDEQFDPNKCSCGSGEYKEAQYDARGIFLTYTCDVCEKDRLSGFRPEVLSNPNYESDEPIESFDDPSYSPYSPDY